MLDPKLPSDEEAYCEGKDEEGTNGSAVGEGVNGEADEACMSVEGPEFSRPPAGLVRSSGDHFLVFWVLCFRMTFGEARDFEFGEAMSALGPPLAPRLLPPVRFRGIATA